MSYYGDTCFSIKLRFLFLNWFLSVSEVRTVSVEWRLGQEMPYILVTTQIRLETGPCIVGDEKSDPEIMKYLEAEQKREAGQFFKV